MWSGDTSPLAAARHQAWLYRQAASALRARGDELLAKEFDAMADAEDNSASLWRHAESSQGWPDFTEYLN